VLRDRLPRTLELAEEMLRQIRDDYTRFVEFCERKERETGEPVTIIASY
jgi:hypothetical protein